MLSIGGAVKLRPAENRKAGAVEKWNLGWSIIIGYS
jgi:hypothetical protein